MLLMLAKNQELPTGLMLTCILVPVLLSAAILPAIFILGPRIARKKVASGTSRGLRYEITPHELRFILSGWQRFFAFKKSITIPRSCITEARRDERIARADPFAIKWCGTHLPGAISAGTFRENGQKGFWYVIDASKVVVIFLHDHAYSRIVVQVDDPDTLLSALAKVLF